MAVGIVMPLFALGASALGIAAEWNGCNFLAKGVLGLAGGVGTNGLFDWLKSRWFTSAPGADTLLKNHHLAQLTGTALRRGFELAAAEAEILDAAKRGIALHAPRLRKLAGAAAERWLSLVDDMHTPQFDALRTARLTEVVTAVCQREGAAPVLEAADWEPLVRAVDSLEGGKSLSPAAIAHTALVLRERIARLFYELVKDARETSPEAYAALQLHFFADLKGAAAEQREELRAIRTEIESLTIALADGAGAQTRRTNFNWTRLTAMLKPMKAMTEEWRAFYTRHDQRWDVLIAKLDTLPDATAARVWDRLPHRLRLVLPALLALLVGAGLAAWWFGRKLDEQSARQTDTHDEIRSLRETISRLSTVADQILGARATADRAGATERPGSALADAAAARGQQPDELRAELASTAAAAARLAKESKGDEARDLWRKAGDLAAAADDPGDAERYYRAALALANPGSPAWCNLAVDVSVMLARQSRIPEELALLAEIVKTREALGEIPALCTDLERLRRSLDTHGQYPGAEDAARRVIALAPKFPASPADARGDCLAALMGAQMQSGAYPEIDRIAREFSALDFGPTDEGRARSLAGLMTAATLLFAYGDHDGGLEKIDRASTLDVRDPSAQRYFVETAVAEIIRVFPALPRPPRARRLLDELLKQADALVARDFVRFGMLLHTRAAEAAASGEFERELTLMRDGLARARKAFPEGHVEIALWQSDLARLLRAPDEEAEAEALWGSALPVLERRMGRQHSVPLNVKAERAHFFGSTDRIERAETEFREVLATLQRILPPWHPRVIAAKFDVLATLGAPARAAEARELREEIYTTLRDHPRPEHMAVQPLFNRYLNMRLTENERSRLATDFGRIVSSIESRLPQSSYLRFLALTNYTGFLEAAGRTSDATALVPRIIESSTHVVGGESIIHARLLVSSANLLNRYRDVAGAERLLRQSIEIARKSALPAFIARQQRDLAQFLLGIGRAAEGRQELDAALRTLEPRSADEPALYFDIMGDLGAAYIGTDDMRAESLLRRSMEEEERQSGFDPFTMERRAANLGWLLHTTGRTREAEQMLLRVMQAPGNHPDGSPKLRVGMAFFNYTTILIETGRAREAETRLRRCLPGSPQWERRAEDLYRRALRTLGWEDAAISQRLEHIFRGDMIPPL